jgi:hypothetical protein
MRSAKLTLFIHPLLVPRLRKSRSYTSSHPKAPLWSITGSLYLYRTTHNLSRTETVALLVGICFASQLTPNPHPLLPRPICSCISNQFLARGLLIALMTEAAGTSETSVNLFKTTRRSIPSSVGVQMRVKLSNSTLYHKSRIAAGPNQVPRYGVWQNDSFFRGKAVGATR